VRRQSRQTWISRNIDSMLFVVFCPLQPGQVSGVPQGSSVTGTQERDGGFGALRWGFSMTNVLWQSRQTWISVKSDSTVLTVLCE
jgi:hypothetical protein